MQWVPLTCSQPGAGGPIVASALEVYRGGDVLCLLHGMRAGARRSDLKLWRRDQPVRDGGNTKAASLTTSSQYISRTVVSGSDVEKHRDLVECAGPASLPTCTPSTSLRRRRPFATASRSAPHSAPHLSSPRTITTSIRPSPGPTSRSLRISKRSTRPPRPRPPRHPRPSRPRPRPRSTRPRARPPGRP